VPLRVLLVDDDELVLNALRRELSSVLGVGPGKPQIEAVASPREALGRAGLAEYDLVIADYGMPEMDGVQFLKAFQEIQPDAARIILSGQLDRDNLSDAINRTHIYRFVAKPWTEMALASAVTQALAYRRVVSDNRRLAQVFQKKFGHAPPRAEERRYHILVVDDDENVLRAVGRELSQRSRFGELYSVLYHEAHPTARLDARAFRFVTEVCTSPRDALEWAEETDYDVVIADYRMPEMDGIRLLEALRRRRPDTGRILLSGEADVSALIEAVNRAEIFCFVEKPWSEFELRTAVIQVISWRNLVLENRNLANAMGGG